MKGWKLIMRGAIPRFQLIVYHHLLSLSIVYLFLFIPFFLSGCSSLVI